MKHSLQKIVGGFTVIEYATFSNVGEKENNEDTVKVFVNPQTFTYGFVLADGLGGHGNGDVASNLVADCVGAIIENTDDITDTFLDECFSVSQRILMDEKEMKGLPSIKTTMVVLIINGRKASWGHVGDSRLYHFKKGKMISRTIDHSVPQMLAISGEIKESEIRHHPDRNKLLRALGIDDDSFSYEIDKINRRTVSDDTFLLCSDGFWEWIDEKTMSSILKKDLSVHDALMKMVSIVKSKGEGNDLDNYSAILVRIKKN